MKRHLKRLNQVHRKKLIDDLANVEFISLTTDFWCDRSSRSYVCITGHWFTEQMDFRSKVLVFAPFPHRHTSANISFELDKYLTSLNIFEKVTTITCDGAQNIKSAFKNIDARIQRLHCIAHKIHLIICNALGLWSKKEKRGNDPVASGKYCHSTM